MLNLDKVIGKTDIYLLDLILSHQMPSNLTVLDAGCGRGRNLHIFAQVECDVYGIDQDGQAVATVRGNYPEIDPSHFRVGELDETGFPDDTFGLVICNAVLHFARDETHFEAMIQEMWRILAPKGILFCRLASSIGIEEKTKPALGHNDPRWRRLPDGSDRFLVDLDFLLAHTETLEAQLLGPIKTINVQGQRCMTNWVMKKP